MESGFTFLLGARKKECFYETLKVNMSLDLEYQVSLVDFVTPEIVPTVNYWKIYDMSNTRR